MEASVLNLNTVFSISSSCTSRKTTSCQSISIPLTGLSFRPRKKLNQSRLSCLKLERKLEAEMNPEGDDWLMELGKLQEKCCKEKRGMVETLECLEKEAIMGEDEGRQPIDYHRRAQIFDKSSRVFQALKERTAPSHS